MQSFSTLNDALAAIKALPGYVPTLSVSGIKFEDEKHDNGNSTFSRYVTTIYSYCQEIGSAGYKKREAIICKVSDWDTGELQSVKLSLPVLSETAEGFTRVTPMPAGQQPVEYQLSSCAFELPTDLDVTNNTLPRGCLAFTGSGTCSDTNPIIAYHHYQIPAALTLGDVAAEWENLPRFTTLECDTGFYVTPGDQTTWKRMGGFTLDSQGITLCGTNTVPAKMPPGGIFATVDLVPQVPIRMSSGQPIIGSDGIPEIDYAVAGGDYTNLGNGTAAIFDLYIRIKTTRSRPCDRDSNNVEIRPYMDIDWDLTRKK